MLRIETYSTKIGRMPALLRWPQPASSELPSRSVPPPMTINLQEGDPQLAHYSLVPLFSHPFHHRVLEGSWEGAALKKEVCVGSWLYNPAAAAFSGRAAMALAQELYSFPASKLDSFVAQWLQPTREWKDEVLETVRTVEDFLRQENFRGERGLARDVQVLKVVKVRLTVHSQPR